MTDNPADRSYLYDEDVPPKLRGHRLVKIFVKNRNDISICSSDVDHVPDPKVKTKPARPVVVIRGLSEEVVQRVYELAGQWRKTTSLSTMPLTRETIFQALMIEGD
jgi:hypothetical protein